MNETVNILFMNAFDGRWSGKVKGCNLKVKGRTLKVKGCTLKGERSHLER